MLKRILSTSVLISLMLWSGGSAVAGNIAITGHDDDFHGSAQGNAQLAAMVSLARNGSTLPVLTFDQASQLTGRLTALGIPFTNISTAGAVNAGLFNPALYSAMAVASDQSCGGCDNNATMSAALAAQATPITLFLNAGRGIVAFAGASNAGYYAFLPATAAATALAPNAGYFQTPAGATFGIPAVNGDPTHNRFLEPGTGGTSAAYQVAERLTNGADVNTPETLICIACTVTGGVLNSGQTIDKAFGVGIMGVGQTTTLTFTLTNPYLVPLTGVAFTDLLPTGLIVATPSGLVNNCGGLATASGSTVMLTGGTTAATSTCTITVNVTGTTAGLKVNTTGLVSSTEAGNGNSATATIQIVTPPSISKAFGAPAFAINGTTTLTIVLSNPNGLVVDASFTDTLPAGLSIANPNGLSSNCGGTLSAAATTGSITLTGGTIAANSTCTITVTVTGTTAGTKVNVTSAIASTLAGIGNSAIATVVVALPATISKAFGVAVIPLNGVTTLTFVITNPNAGTVLTGVAVTDNLPAGLQVANPNGLTSNCGGTATATAGSGVVSLVNGALAANASCTITVNVIGIATGLQVNLTDPITSVQGGVGGSATAAITVGGNFLINYASNLTSGPSAVDLTNTGANGASLNGPGFGGAVGNICMNVYAFSPDEQLVSCCSCLLTPNALAALSVNADLVSNTLTGVRPNSVVVKIVPTGAGAAFTGTSCTNSAALAGQNAANPLLASGGLAYGTTVHAQGTGFAVTENRYIQSTLSAQELASITNRCANIIGNGSTFGICRSCQSGGLGATK